MEDVMTEAAPPSRFLEEDLNIFTTPSPPLPKPFLISQPHTPSLLIVALPAPSLALFRRLRSSTPAASLLLPELPLSRPNHTADLFALSPSALLAAMLPGVPYYPSGSVVDGLGAAILARCQVLNVRASLCVSWPRFDASVVSLVKGLLQRGVLRGFEFDLGDEDLKFGRSEDRVLHSELYI
uniref:Uncharacterized protein n=1 Tax=Cajanus cajan TaxID=3821 RepID=A0A151SY51_CAJCA|nr:hypothetical protein KK1_015177 [Cajanus cajan]